MDALKHRNLVAAIAHFITGLTVLIWYSLSKPAQKLSSFTAFRNTPATEADYNSAPTSCSTSQMTTYETPSQCNTEIAFTKPAKVVSINVVIGAIAFFMITAFAHTFYATDGFGTRTYSRAIQQGWNPYRWFEYAASASIMSVIIGLSDGTRDVTTLWSLAIMTIAMMFNGYSTESLLRGTAKVGEMARESIKSSTASGWLLFAGIWTTLIYSFATLVADVKTKFSGVVDNNGKPIAVPTWIWFIVFLQLIYYSLFGIVQLRHISARLSGQPYSYITTENSYITLSYFAKLSLASGLGYGLLFRTKNCP